MASKPRQQAGFRLCNVLDRLFPPAGPGSLRIWGVPKDGGDQAWWPSADEDPDELERAARHPHWDDKPQERAALLNEARRLRS